MVRTRGAGPGGASAFDRPANPLSLADAVLGIVWGGSGAGDADGPVGFVGSGDIGWP
ncbi:MAG TPA: hypothetical protein VK697_14045 [Methylomirabilota bacterium]|nr:hypothetical protein [Methylomirabilota bacterium]